MKEIQSTIQQLYFLTNDKDDLMRICDQLQLTPYVNFDKKVISIWHEILKLSIKQGPEKYQELLETVHEATGIVRNFEYPSYKTLQAILKPTVAVLNNENRINSSRIKIIIALVGAIIATITVTMLLKQDDNGITVIVNESQKEVPVSFYQEEDTQKQFVAYNDTVLNEQITEVVLIPRKKYKKQEEKTLNRCQIAILLSEKATLLLQDSNYLNITTLQNFEFMKQIEDLAYFDRSCQEDFDLVLKQKYQVELNVEEFPSTFKLRADRYLNTADKTTDPEQKERYYELAMRNYEDAATLLKRQENVFKEEITKLGSQMRLASTKRNFISFSPTHELVKIPAGNHESIIGAESSNRTTLRALPTFYIDKYEVSIAQFRKFQAVTSYMPESDGHQDYLPVVNVSWETARAYCQSIGLRLPTELEWEKAALWNDDEGKRYTFPWGKERVTENIAGFSPFIQGVQKVQAFEQGASAYGIFNLFGNVAEWMNIEAGQDSTSYIARGGAWVHTVDNIDKFVRIKMKRNENWLGFRCACNANNLPRDLLTDFYSN